MRLVSPASVLGALGIQEQQGSLAVAGWALDAITTRFEAVLERKFSEAAVTDFYDILPGSGIKKGVSFRLTYGEVSGVVVRYSPDGVLPADAVNGVIAVAAEYAVVSKDGIVTLLVNPPYGYRALSISYTVGYSTSPTTKLPDGLPQWIADAAIAAGVAALQSNPANVAKDKTRFIGEFALPELRGIYRSMLAPHFRPRAGLITPTVSAVVDA